MNLVLHSVAWIWDIFLEVLLVMDLGYCSEEEELINQILRTTFSANTRSWYTHISFSTILLAKRKLLNCFKFFSMLKAGDITTTRNYMIYQTFSNLQFRHLFKNFFHNIRIDLRETSGKDNILNAQVSHVLFRCLEKPSTFNSNAKDVSRWLLQNN